MNDLVCMSMSFAVQRVSKDAEQAHYEALCCFQCCLKADVTLGRAFPCRIALLSGLLYLLGAAHITCVTALFRCAGVRTGAAGDGADGAHHQARPRPERAREAQGPSSLPVKTSCHGLAVIQLSAQHHVK